MEILLYGLDSLLCFAQLVVDAVSASWVVSYLVVNMGAATLHAFFRFDLDMPMLPMNNRFSASTCAARLEPVPDPDLF